jgi:hypothetical protein
LVASAETVRRELPALLGPLGYRDIFVEDCKPDCAQILAATPSSWQSFGHGVRVIVEPLRAEHGDCSLVRLVLARRLPSNGSEDLEAARDRLIRALRAKFGASS